MYDEEMEIYVRLCLKNFLRSLCAIIFLIQEIDLNVQFFSSFVRSFGAVVLLV